MPKRIKASGGGGGEELRIPCTLPLDPPLTEIHGGNQLWFEFARGSSLSGLELSGVNCNIFQQQQQQQKQQILLKIGNRNKEILCN